MQTRSASEIHLKPAHCATLDVIVRRRHFELRRPFASHFTRLLPLPFFSFASWRLTTPSAGALIEITIVSGIHLRPDYRATLHVIVRRRPPYRVPHTYNPLFYFKLTTIISAFIARVRLTTKLTGRGA
jgi:hypothetical protein